MFQLIETICYENGFFHRLALHERRMNNSRRQLLSCRDFLFLERNLSIPEQYKNMKIKCRVTYSDVIHSIEFEQYNEREIKSLRLVQDDTIDYSHKFKNRDQLNHLLELRGDDDEILIVKNGQVTDTSFTNIAFLKDGQWFTPEFPLLAGTRRDEYLQNGLLTARIIRPEDLRKFDEARLVNSMRSLEDGPSIAISNIH